MSIENNTIAEIRLLTAVSEATNVPVSAIKGERRVKSICAARFLAMAIMRHHFPLCSWIEIAEKLGKKDHSTIYYGVCRYHDLYQKDPVFRGLADKLGIPARVH
jgi:chromosomal replication initiation ATPase DnaA